MVDENTTGEGQAPDPAAGQAPTPNGQAPEGTQTPEPSAPGDMSLEDARKLISDLRAENAKRRAESKELDELRQFKAQTEEAQLSEQEKAARRMQELQEQADAATQTAREAKLETAIAVQAGALGLVDPDAALRLIDRSNVQFADDGAPDPESVAEALEALVEQRPYLRGSPPAPNAGSPANPARPEGLTQEQARDLARTDPKQFNELFEAGQITASALGGAAR